MTVLMLFSELVVTELKSFFLIYFLPAGMGTTEKILKNQIFYCFTYSLCRLKEAIQRYQTTPKVSETMKYSIFLEFFDYLLVVLMTFC